VQSSELAWGVLLYHLGKEGTGNMVEKQIEWIGHRLRLPNKMIQSVTACMLDQKCFDSSGTMSLAQLKRFIRKQYFSTVLELFRLYSLANNKDLQTYFYYRQKLREFSTENLNPAPLITGDDLIELGFTPGSIFQNILCFMEDQQLEGSIADREEAIALVKTKFATYLSN
jgi:poly(A) polymerase